MKKIFISCAFIFIVLIGLFLGIVFFNKKNLENDYKKIVEFGIVNNEDVEETEEDKLELVNNIIEVNASEENISPNCTIIKKKLYKKCNHLLKEYEDVDNSLVNLGLKEFEKIYKDWKIDSFTEKEIVISKEFEGECKEHFLLKEKDGNIAIYIIDENNRENFDKLTTISLDYLTKTDLIKIKNGIKANGLEELNSILEDFE